MLNPFYFSRLFQKFVRHVVSLFGRSSKSFLAGIRLQILPLCIFLAVVVALTAARLGLGLESQT